MLRQLLNALAAVGTVSAVVTMASAQPIVSRLSDSSGRPLVFQKAGHDRTALNQQALSQRPPLQHTDVPRHEWQRRASGWSPTSAGLYLDETPYHPEPSGLDGGCDSCCDVGGCSGAGGCSGVGGCCGVDGILDSVALYGWLSQGFTWNPDSPADRFNGPMTFNDRSNEYQMNQLYLVLERQICSDTCHWDFGGRVDLLYGTDYFFTTAIGLETHQDGTPRWNSDEGPRGSGASLYGVAMPQLYAEVYAPFGSGLTFMLGHFYSILGYESVMSPDNFFYSHTYAKQYGEPFTHTGVLASYDLSPCLTFLAGFTRGWDTWEDINNNEGLLTGVFWTAPGGHTSLAFALHSGNEDAGGQNNRTLYSIVFEHEVTPCLTYVFQHDFGIEEDAETNRDFQLDEAKWYGISQYLMYSVCPTLAAGVRVEWFHDQDNARVIGIPFESLVEGGNYVALTMGMNWQPCQNMVVRPELRWDSSDVEAPSLQTDGVFDDFGDKDQLTLSTNVIWFY